MKRPDGNIVVLTFEALLSCVDTYANCKDLLSTRLVASVLTPGDEFFCCSQRTDLSYDGPPIVTVF
jgi:hypothetical protein